jgi:hypothetical protein
MVLRAPAFNAIVSHGPGAALDAILERISLPSCWLAAIAT